MHAVKGHMGRAVRHGAHGNRRAAKIDQADLACVAGQFDPVQAGKARGGKADFDIVAHE